MPVDSGRGISYEEEWRDLLLVVAAFLRLTLFKSAFLLQLVAPVHNPAQARYFPPLVHLKHKFPCASLDEEKG